MIANNFFLTLLLCFVLVTLSAVMVSLAGLTYFTLLPLVLSVVFSLIILISVEKSIKELSDTVTKAARGDFSVRVSREHTWEIEPVGEAINDLLDNLHLIFDEWKDNRNELKFILESITEALWVQTKDNQILWTSNNFAQLFPEYQKGKLPFYWEIIREPEIVQYIKDFLAGSHTEMREIELSGHHYLLRGAVHARTDKTIFILQNIDALKQVEQMKKDFVVNVAHELRTPLTAIKGFTEALLDTAAQEHHRYLHIIQNHTDRLINMITDLQTLANLERLPELNLTEINVQTYFDSIRALFLPRLEEKGLELVLELDPRLPSLRIDPFKFEQIFINLIDNAIRHTTSGSITIQLKKLPNAVGIKVCDTGSGIEPEHLPRIFERFYVADASRNRNSVGTGLGLAIVKHAVLLHQGTLDVSSDPGKGTCFWMQFPLPETAQ